MCTTYSNRIDYNGVSFSRKLGEWVLSNSEFWENRKLRYIWDTKKVEKKTTSPHFMLLTNYASFSMHESIISTLCVGSSSPVVASQLTWTFFRRKKLLCLTLHWDLFALNVTEEESDKVWITRIQFGRKSPWRCPQSTSDFIMSR